MAEGECSANWNLMHPGQVASVHCAYLEAGAEVLLTNTFLANLASLEPFGLRDRLQEIWTAALANTQIFRGPAPIILADIGPVENASLNVILEHCHYADGILLETWSCTPQCWLEPLINLTDLNSAVPAILSFTYRRKTGHRLRTFNDAAPEDCALAAFSSPVCALGVNCGNEIDMDELLDIVRRYRDITDLPIFVRPNAGTPRRTSRGWEYPRSPEYMADKLWPLLEAGVTMVGGCCGTTPAHIAAFRRVVDEWNAGHPKK
jgi:5-methyltetrahydrofolate--homocysteine methyltransferase